MLELFDKPHGKVLDVGCGPAEMVQDLLNLGCEFWGVDPSPRMIEICHARHGETRKDHFLLGDAGRLEFPDRFFDVVVCMGVIDGLEDARQAVGEMARDGRVDWLAAGFILKSVRIARENEANA